MKLINILPNLIDWFNNSNQINKMIIWHVLCEFKSVRVSVSAGTANKIIVEHALPLSLTKISKLQVEVQYRSTSAYTTFECRLLKCQRWSVIVCMLSPILEIFISFNSELTMKFIKLTASRTWFNFVRGATKTNSELKNHDASILPFSFVPAKGVDVVGMTQPHYWELILGKRLISAK